MRSLEEKRKGKRERVDEGRGKRMEGKERGGKGKEVRRRERYHTLALIFFHFEP